MPRDVSGTYTLPAGNPVVTATTISITWANTTLSDIATALTASLSIDGSVTTAKLATNSVTTVKITDLNVTTGKLADLAVTAAKLAADSVTTAKILDDNVTYAKIQDVSATDKILGRSTAGAGVIEEITCTAAGRALIDDATAADQRTTLGLSTMSTQAAGAVAITGGTITGITDLAVADGGTGASTASAARTNLGVVIGTDVQAYDADLAALAALASTGLVARTGSGTVAARTITGTANKVTVTNGDGVSGNPTLTIPDAVTLVTPTVTGLLTASGGQIAFPATQVPSADPNTLDDYEEGTWTPTISFETPGDLSVAYGTRTGFYTKIGRKVTLICIVETSSFTHTTASGNLTISTIPFSPSTRSYGTLVFEGITKASYTSFASSLAASSSVIEAEASGSGQAISAITAADMPTGGTVKLRITITYFV